MASTRHGTPHARAQWRRAPNSFCGRGFFYFLLPPRIKKGSPNEHRGRPFLQQARRTMSSNSSLPSASTLSLLAISIPVLLYLRALAGWRRRTRGRPLPPGPRPLPLVRLKVETTGVAEMSNPVRFGQDFIGRLANPRDVLAFLDSL